MTKFIFNPKKLYNDIFERERNTKNMLHFLFYSIQFILMLPVNTQA